MKRFLPYFLSVTLGFSSGLLIIKISSVSTPSTEINRPLAVSICELNHYPERYDGKLIQIKAVIHGDRGGHPYVVDESCNTSDAPLSKITGVYVEPNEAFAILPQWATYTSFCGNDTYAASVDGLAAEVILIGIYNSGASQIIPRSVTQLSAVSKGR